jgi:hypothetical protein
MTHPVRVLAPLLLLGLAGAMFAPPAEACPRGALCVAVDSERAEIPAPAPRPAATIRVALAAPADPLPALRFSGSRIPSGTDPMPWIWTALRARVYSQLPTQRSESLTLTLAPVVVTGQYDTIPGVGVSGAFD